MENVQARPRLHPLVAGAAAAIGGYLPGSKAGQKETSSRVEGKTRVRIAAACTECGVVVSITEKTVMGHGTGIGAVVGGVAGHQIERSARSTKRYEIAVRMQDGSIKTAQTDAAPAWHAGDKVRLHDGVVKPL